MIKKIRYYFTEYFSFSKRERNGIIILIFLIFIVFAIRLMGPKIIKTETITVPDSVLLKEAYAFQYEISANNSVSSFISDDTEEERYISELEKPEPVLFNFDPNVATINEFVKLGLNQFVINNIIEFRRKGGRFTEKENLKRIYGLSTRQYEIIEPYIKINKESKKVDTENNTTSIIGMGKIRIEINSADAMALIRLPGIGEIFANRIIKYRDLLGGFYSIDQLNEVYGIKDSLINLIQQDIYIDTLLIHKLNINIADMDELKAHPYLTDYEANSIIFYRTKVGKIKNLEELTENNIVSEMSYKRIEHYLILK